MLGGDQDYSPASPTANTHELFKANQRTLGAAQRKKNKNKNSRRFSDEQIKSLESLFKMENKLEPRKKLEMARELGLQPRQVAIWFQNRRARWKSKQMEQEYRSLKADYDNLSDRFESLKKEKHALLIQLRSLCSQLKEPHEGSRESKDLEENSTDSGSENGDTNFELNGNSSCFSGPLEQDVAIYSDDDDQKKKSCYLGPKEAENLNMGDQVVDGLSEEPHETLANYDLGGLFDQSCSTSSNWWDYWS